MKEVLRYINKNIRPKLNSHNGDLEVIGFEDGILSIRFTGQCSGCPSAKMTLEDLVEYEIKEKFSQIKKVRLVDNFSAEDYDLAKKLMMSHKVKHES